MSDVSHAGFALPPAVQAGQAVPHLEGGTSVALRPLSPIQVRLCTPSFGGHSGGRHY